MIGLAGHASAADSTEVQQLKEQIARLQQQMNSIQQQLNAPAQAPVASGTGAVTGAQGKPLSGPENTAAGSVANAGHGEHDSSALSTRIGNTSVTLYGFADLSADVGSDGVNRVRQVSSNLSYVGVRATRPLGASGLQAFVQIETLANISGTPTETGGLASRNSFVGLGGRYGKLMLGKSDTPYKRATAAMDPFASSVGDYNGIMGNTGGDLRAEFDARVPHAIWFESAPLAGFTVNAMVSPGQKFRNLENSDKYAFAQGEKLCAGATPGSSGSLPDAGSTLCNDGAFTNVYSTSLNYTAGPLFVTLGYEKHQAVDRSSDNGGVVSNESAAKVGVTYNFGTNRLSGIYEKFNRGGGIDPTFNERARKGYYLSDVQELGGGLDLNAAWAHAGNTPGGPDFETADDKANMYALGVKYHYDKQLSLYALGAWLKQGAGAHYVLGASGHGTAIASPRNDDGETIPGQTIKALSAGMQYVF